MGVLRDFSMDAWEVLFSYLALRHLARLAMTGDKRVLYALEHAWRRCDTTTLDTIMPHTKTDSDLVKRVLVGKSRRLTARAGDLVYCGEHFPSLDSLHIGGAEIGFSCTHQYWPRYMVKHGNVLDLASMTPNLRSLHVDSSLKFELKLPPLLETLELYVTHTTQSLSRLISFDGLHHLTTLRIDGGFPNGVLSPDLTLPSTIVTLSIALHESDLPFVDNLPSSITRLHIVNSAGKLSTTCFAHLPLVELKVDDMWDGETTGMSCTILGVLPTSLTSMDIGKFGVCGTMSDLIYALRSLPPTLTHMSFRRLLTVPSRDEMREILEVLSPHIDVPAMKPILLFAHKHHHICSRADDEPLERQVLSMLETRGLGADFLAMIAMVAMTENERVHWRINSVMSIVQSGMRRAYMADVVACDEEHYARVTMVPKTNSEYPLIVEAMRLGLVNKLKVDVSGWPGVPADAASSIETLEIVAQWNASFIKVFETAFERLTELFIFELPSSSGLDWDAIAIAIRQNIVNMPRLETIYFKSQDGNEPSVTRLEAELKAVGFRHIRLLRNYDKIVFRFFV